MKYTLEWIYFILFMCAGYLRGMNRVTDSLVTAEVLRV